MHVGLPVMSGARPLNSLVLGAAAAKASGEDLSGRGQQLDHVRVEVISASRWESWLLSQLLSEPGQRLSVRSSAAADTLQQLTSGRYDPPWGPCAT
jgi:hypothetical protein